MITTESNRYTTGAIIEGLRAKDNRIITYIYGKYYSKVRKMVTCNSGLSEDAEDLFQDAMLIIINNIRSSTFKLTSSFGTYLFSISWHLWLQRLHKSKKNRMKSVAGFREYEQTEAMDLSFYQSELLRLVQFHFEKLDQRSKQLLTLFMNGTPHKVTAEIMGYRSAEYAKIRKYYCKETLRVLVENDPAFKRLRKEMLEN